ncbi:polysaccharide deacetylase family protein (PEP-CTERM system associated) [Paenibacillus forsythiae]|uniref:Polysaccharide deacetylase family protein (PEP-CTERM system associated) n=1 Tax=Paenibacillus forsythiae TaxID=365616 RepID=A0ABU3H6I1_9BACL|nr:polysaccharide deacetylase family protein [Paenibacillus forsythiae]MDT3425325.1 polysaccharide deacetylase family protein (PEP-CTERM system associated) [Paenibacillus forsythiae]
MGQPIIFTVDLEDWFTDGRQIQIDSWGKYELVIEANVYAILDLLSKHNAKATFFILGWIACKKPHLIQEIHAMGHEIASHGYAHELVYTLPEEKFRHDVRKSKQALEDIIGAEVIGYRAPCFSMTWRGLDILKNEGFIYDSSIVPRTCHDLYSRLYERVEQPFFEIADHFWELSLPALSIGSVQIPWGGGGYFRFCPYPLFQYGIRKSISSRNPYIFYIHPYDLDPKQPRRTDYSLLNRLRRYYGLKSARNKLERLIGQFECKSIVECYPLLKQQMNKKWEA